MENKELIGYKFVKPEYNEAVLSILNTYSHDWWKENAENNFKEKGYHFYHIQIENSVTSILKKAGVLNLWFEPVYKEIESQFKKDEWLYWSKNNSRALLRYNNSFNGSVTTDEYYQLYEHDKLIDSGSKSNYVYIKDCTKATSQQIQEILTIVAKHKGFVEGVKYISPISKVNNTCIGDFIYNEYNDILSCNGIAIYNISKWATISPTELVKSWEDAYKSNGYIINSENKISQVDWIGLPSLSKRVFKAKAQAKSALAFAQLSHIVADANGDWVANFEDYNQDKYVIVAERNKVVGLTYGYNNNPLPMKSEEIRDTCLEKHRILWEDFWMISK